MQSPELVGLKRFEVCGNAERVVAVGARSVGEAAPSVVGELKWILSLDLESQVKNAKRCAIPPVPPPRRAFFFGSHHESLTER